MQVFSLPTPTILSSYCNYSLFLLQLFSLPTATILPSYCNYSLFLLMQLFSLPTATILSSYCNYALFLLKLFSFPTATILLIEFINPSSSCHKIYWLRENISNEGILRHKCIEDHPLPSLDTPLYFLVIFLSNTKYIIMFYWCKKRRINNYKY